MSTATAAFMGTAVLPGLLLTWRCKGCRRIICRLEYNGRQVIQKICKCNARNQLPEDRRWLRAEHYVPWD